MILIKMEQVMETFQEINNQVRINKSVNKSVSSRELFNCPVFFSADDMCYRSVLYIWTLEKYGV